MLFVGWQHYCPDIANTIKVIVFIAMQNG